MVEAWAAGGTWAQVTADSNLDDGDIMRLLNRTSDLLRQARLTLTNPAQPRLRPAPSGPCYPASLLPAHWWAGTVQLIFNSMPLKLTMDPGL